MTIESLLIGLVGLFASLNNTTAGNQSTASAGVFVGALALFAILQIIWLFTMIMIFIIWVAGIVFWIWMLIDCVKRKKFYSIKENGPLIWILIILFGNVLGAIIYYFVEKRKTPPE